MPKIEYKMWQPLGPAGCLYIHDVDKKYYSDTKNIGRKAWFVCPRCGNGFLSWIASVKNGKKQSCGCKNKDQARALGKKNARDITGMVSGFLTAIEKTNRQYTERRTYYWKCYCDCGLPCHLREEDRYTEVVVSDITGGHTKKTDKCSKSIGELLIYKALKDLDVDFVPQYIFSDCINPKSGRPLKFDFYIPSYNACIEYDGEQHYRYQNNHGWNTKKNYEETVYRDGVKDAYCLSHNIHLIRIPYKEQSHINSSYILGLLENERSS